MKPNIFGVIGPGFLNQVPTCRGLKNYQYRFGGFLIIIIV